jgi:hypothetical protein
MARPKRASTALLNAEQRAAAIASISEKLDLGNGLALSPYQEKIAALRNKINVYNTTLSTVDDLSRDIKEMEKELRDLSQQMLLGVGARYGTDSREYGKAGGVRKSERKRPGKTNAKTQQKAIDPEPTETPIGFAATARVAPELLLNTMNLSPNSSTNGSTNGKAPVS